MTHTVCPLGVSHSGADPTGLGWVNRGGPVTLGLAEAASRDDQGLRRCRTTRLTKTEDVPMAASTAEPAPDRLAAPVDHAVDDFGPDDHAVDGTNEPARARAGGR